MANKQKNTRQMRERDYNTRVILRRLRQQERLPKEQRVKNLVDEWLAEIADPNTDAVVFLLTKLAEREIQDRITEEDQL